MAGAESAVAAGSGGGGSRGGCGRSSGAASSEGPACGSAPRSCRWSSSSRRRGGRVRVRRRSLPVRGPLWEGLKDACERRCLRAERALFSWCSRCSDCAMSVICCCIAGDAGSPCSEGACAWMRSWGCCGARCSRCGCCSCCCASCWCGCCCAWHGVPCRADQCAWERLGSSSCCCCSCSCGGDGCWDKRCCCWRARCSCCRCCSCW